MKKLIIAFCFIIISAVSYGQSYTFTSDGDTIKATEIYNLINGTSFTSMKDICQSYAMAIKVNGSDSCLVAYDAALDNYFYTESSPPWNWLGKFRGIEQTNIWFLPPNGASITILFTDFIK